MAELSILKLSDGRRLGYRIYGDPDGAATLYFHGLNGTSLEAATAEDRLWKRGCCLVAFDRPGFGASDPRPGRTVAGTAEEGLRLMDRLGIEKFDLLGFSAGAAYLTALAARHPRRVRSARILSGAVPVTELGSGGMGAQTRLLILLARHAPGMLERVFAWKYGRRARRGGERERLLATLIDPALPRERALLTDPAVSDTLWRSVVDSYRQGSAANAEDAVLVFGRSWETEYRSIETEKITVVHGAEDRIIPPALAERFAGLLGGAELCIVEEEGHLSLLFGELHGTE